MVDEARSFNLKIQRIVGGAVFLLALIVYFRSVAPTTSFWDCGEFIACSRILGVMHPPGAPLYLLIGRILTMLPFFGDVGLRVNVFSVLTSAATVWLTFLIIVQLIQRWRGQARTWEDRFIVFASGALGALAFAFTDSFWFNAVEAEVYAFSMFLTALVVWLALVWGERSEEARSRLIIFFIFYLFGLATGVHLLNILAFPFVLLIAFFHQNQTVKKLLLLIFVQFSVPTLLYVVFYQFDPMSIGFEALLAHQAKAWNFLKWFGGIWVAGSLIYIYVKDRRVFNAWWVAPLLFALGYSVYAILFVRAGLAPPINENDPSTVQSMMDYMARKQYGESSMFLTFFFRQADFWHYQIQTMYTRYFGWQFIGQGTTLDSLDRVVEIISLRGLYGLPFLVGLWGTVHHFFKDWKRAVAVLVLFLLMGYAIVIYLNQPDPQPRERDYSYVGSFFAFALWIGIGLAGVLEWISEAVKDRTALKRGALGIVSVLLFVAVPLNLYAFNHRSHSRAKNYVAWDYSYNILESCEPDGILFTNGDNDTFPLWYLQEVEGIRKDVRVVCLSLLNTPWYIKQLRDLEPKVPINLSDQLVERLGPIAWEEQQRYIPVSDEVIEAFKPLLDEEEKASLSDRVTFTLKPTFADNRALRVQDLMILRILQESRWRRPVYFAMTVSQENRIGLDAFLRLEGLAFRVVPYRVRNTHREKMNVNLFEKFRYRGLDDPTVYFSVGTVKLLQNFRSAYTELARDYLRLGENDEAGRVLDAMGEKIPPEVVPFYDERHAVVTYDLYRRMGRTLNIDTLLTHVLPGRLMSREDRLLLANYYAQVVRDWDRAERSYLILIREQPNDVEAYYGLFLTYKLSQQYERGISLLEEWVSRHPNDDEAKRELEGLRILAAQDTASSQ